VLIRIPLPYKVREVKYLGNVDEKLHCEVVVYLRIQENSSGVSILYLFGFGFPDGQIVCSIEPVIVGLNVVIKGPHP